MIGALSLHEFLLFQKVCMRKELKSYFDGHHEYEMTCENKQVGTFIIREYARSKEAK